MSGTSSMSSFLKNNFIRAILTSGLFLQIGIWVRNFAVLLYVMKETNGDAFAISMISVAEFAPIFIFSVLGGAFADRWKPKKTMIWCDILSAVSVFVVLATLMFTSWHAVFFAMLISAILSQFSQPAGMKLFKLHVPKEQIQMGMSVYQTMFGVFMILGPVIGTFVFEQFGIFVSIAITGVMFIFSALALTFLPADKEEEAKSQQTTIVEELKMGFQYVLKSRFLTILGCNFLVAGLGIGLIQPLGIFIVTEKLGMDESFLQWFLAINGVAILVGGGLTLGLAKKIAPIRLLALGMLINAFMLSLMGFSEVLWLSLIAQFFSGFVFPAIQISISTMILENSSEEFVGRVNGIMTPLFMGGMVIMMSFAGVLKTVISLTVAYQLAAILFIIGIAIIVPLILKPQAKVEDQKVEAKLT